MSYRRTGLNPLAYMGVEPVTLAADVAFPRAPTNNDINFNLSTRWLDTSTEDVWILVSLDAGIATWVMLTSVFGSVTELTGNTGGPVPPLAGNINILGDTLVGVTVTGNPGTNTLTITSTGGGGFGQTLTGDTGGAVPFSSAGNINTLGVHGINTAGTPGTNTMDIAINNAITLGDLAPVATSLTLQTGDLHIVNANAIVGNTNADALASSVEFEKSRTGGVITTGDDLGGITFAGHDGTAYVTGASILSESSGTIAAGRVAGNLQFYTHPDAVGALTQRMVINPDGSVLINFPDIGGADALTVTGNISLPNTNIAETQGVIKYGGDRFITNFGTNNTFVGRNSGSLVLTVITAIHNSFFGADSGQSLTTGTENVGVGSFALNATTSGSENVGVGYDALTFLVSGNLNIAIGDESGSAYTTNESNNIVIGNAGVIAETNTIRIGGATGGAAREQNRAFFAGINGVTLTPPFSQVVIDANDQLGVSGIGGSSSFMADISASIPNATGSTATPVAIGFDRTYFNEGGDFNTGTGAYTAPIDGIYEFSTTVTLADLAAGMTSGFMSLVVTGTGPCAGTWALVRNNALAVADGISGAWRFNGGVTLQLDAGDIVQVVVAVEGGAGDTATISIGSGGPPSRTWFSGSLIK